MYTNTSYGDFLIFFKIVFDSFLFLIPNMNATNVNTNGNAIVVMNPLPPVKFREPTSKVNRNELANYKVVKPRQIGFVQTTHNEKAILDRSDTACRYHQRYGVHKPYRR